MPREPLVLATLLPALLEGCFWGCGGSDETQMDWLVEPDPEALVAASDSWGELTPEGCRTLCGAEDEFWIEEVLEVYSCELVPAPDTGAPSDLAVSCSGRVMASTICMGRLHASVLARAAPRPRGALRRWLARAAWEEAASVGAFRRLARELARHGAPAALIERARDAARDEIRHARAMRRLSGGVPDPVTFAPPRERTLLEIGLENAVEGCVRETYAALVAHHQARSATPSLRPLFREIARDETGHGQWSWDLDRWLRNALPARDGERLDQARRAGWDALVALADAPAPAVRAALGLPSRHEGRRLARRLAGALG